MNQLVEDLHLATGITGVAINLFDRFLVACCSKAVSNGCLHAVTAACFLIACKTVCDDDGVPCLSTIGKRAKVSVEDMLSMEVVVLNALQWRVGVVTPHEVIAQTHGYVKKKKAVEEDKGGGRRRKRRRRCDSNSESDSDSDSDNSNSSSSSRRIIGDAMLDALLLYALMEYRCAWLRPTSIGVACILVAQVANNSNNNNDNNSPWSSSTCAGQCKDGECDEYGRVVQCIRSEGLYGEAQAAGVDMRQVDWCAYCLFEVVGVLCEDVEDVDDEDEDDM